MTGRVLLWAAMTLVAVTGAHAQGAGATPGVEVSVSPAATRGAGGPTAWLEAVLELPMGMHQILQEEYFGLEVREGGLPEGWSAGAVVYPETTKVIADLPSYEGSVLIRLPLTGPADSAEGFTLRAEVLWQLCYDDGVCLMPVRQAFDLPVSWVQGQGHRAVPTRVVELVEGSVSAGGLGFGLAPVSPAAVPADEPATGPGAYTGPSLGGLLSLLLLAFVGGMILNLMPCVLPVLSIKALSLIKQAGDDAKKRWLHALAATAGILVSLVALAVVLIALRGAGVAIGWGIQFQNPWYVTGLVVLVLVFALSLFDVFYLATPGVTQRKTRGLGGSFLTGLLTVVLATPCTAPFLGTALGLALASPGWVILAVFTAVGVGLALPFALITVIPGALERLPKPGKWLDIFRGVMAFALVGTVIWLLTVLQKQVDGAAFARVLWFLGAVALVVWLYGALQRSSVRTAPRVIARVALAALVVGSALLLLRFPSGKRTPGAASPETVSTGGSLELPAGWSVFSEERVDTLLAQGTPVFVDFTAEWCLTCRINEAGVLADTVVLSAFDDNGVVLLRGDFTSPDPVISAWLTKYRRAGVPFYALLRPGREAVLFPELLTRDHLLKALQSNT